MCVCVKTTSHTILTDTTRTLTHIMPLHFEVSSPLSVRESQLLRTLKREYTPAIARDVLLPLLSQKAAVSLRVLDWAVVNWSRQHNVIATSPTGQRVNVHHSYRVALAHWRRKLFDPFRRRLRIGVHIDGEVHETTLGQANFVLFAYRTGVLAYVLGHAAEIEADMNLVAQRQKRKRKHARASGITHKRTPLTAPGPTTCVAISTPFFF